MKNELGGGKGCRSESKSRGGSRRTASSRGGCPGLLGDVQRVVLVRVAVRVALRVPVASRDSVRTNLWLTGVSKDRGPRVGSVDDRKTEALGWVRSSIGGVRSPREPETCRVGSKCVRPRPRPAVATRAASRRRGPTKGARNPTEGDDGGARLNLPRSAAVAITSGMDEVIGRGSTVTSPMGGAVGQPFWLRPTSL